MPLLEKVISLYSKQSSYIVNRHAVYNNKNLNKPLNSIAPIYAVRMVVILVYCENYGINSLVTNCNRL